MTNTQPSMFQQYKDNKDIVVDFSPLTEKKKHARSVIRNISSTIFEKLGCESVFNDGCISKLDEIYQPANICVELLNFNPARSIFSFRQLVRNGDFMRVANTCKFYTDESAIFSRIETTYNFLVQRNSEYINNRVSVVLDKNFDIEKINYHRMNQKMKLLIDVTKYKDMFCSVDEESMFISLFLNDRSDLQELFPSFYVEGAYTFDKNEIESNMTIARMLLI
jgi:hypothetical protein